MTRKKTTKKVKENEFEVVTKDSSAGPTSGTETTTKVKAGNADQALDQATKANPNVDDADQVMVRKSTPTFGNPQRNQGVVAEGKLMSNKAITESVSYPYSISLPNQFRRILEEVELDYTTVGSTVMVKFDNKTQLNKGLKSLRESEDERAVIVLSGISRSLA